MVKEKTVFTLKDWEQLQEAKRILHDVLPEFDKAESCGNDCQNFREIHAEMLRRLAAIETHYLPVRPER